MFYLSRRQLLQAMGVAVAGRYLPGCTSLGTSRLGSTGFLQDHSPFDRTLSEDPLKMFSGDGDPASIHGALWGGDEFIASITGGGLPSVTEEAEVVVAGGGMSGLLSAYFLRDKKPVVLEQGKRFGGNSRGESWRGVDYSIGAAYFAVPEPGTSSHRLLEELGLAKGYRIREGEDPLYVDGKRFEAVWDEGTEKGSAASFKKLGKYLRDVLEGKSGRKYPEVPIPEGESRDYVVGLDRLTFRQHVERVLGKQWHPHVDRAVEQYFWSAFGASAGEVSAATGLNFFAADFGALAVAPGGNAAIAERLLERLTTSVGADRLRGGSLVLDVRSEVGGVRVTYLRDGKLHAVRAKYVVMAIPKFVVGRVLKGMEPSRQEAIGELDYRSYLVANVLVEAPLRDDFYDIFFFDGGSKGSVAHRARGQGASDVVYGNYGRVDPHRTVLTLYRPFPYEGGRKEVFEEGAFAKYQREFEAQVEKKVLPMLNIPPKAVKGVRTARWGHPVPVSAAGLIADGVVDELRRPFQDRVFFVEQDNWALPGFETCLFEAEFWTQEIRKRLGA